jgi:hypothetical protein
MCVIQGRGFRGPVLGTGVATVRNNTTISIPCQLGQCGCSYFRWVRSWHVLKAEYMRGYFIHRWPIPKRPVALKLVSVELDLFSCYLFLWTQRGRESWHVLFNSIVPTHEIMYHSRATRRPARIKRRQPALSSRKHIQVFNPKTTQREPTEVSCN